MTIEEEAGYLLSMFHKDRVSLRTAFEGPNSSISKSLSKYGIAHSIYLSDAAVLLLSKCYTESDIKFIRAYIGGIPTLYLIKSAKWRFMKSMPCIWILSIDQYQWTQLPSGRAFISGTYGRSTICVRISVIEAVHLNDLRLTNMWSIAPCLAVLSKEKRRRTFVYLFLSIGVWEL